MLLYKRLSDAPPTPPPRPVLRPDAIQPRRSHAVRRVIAHMHENLDAPQQLEELAEVACCSPWHLVRIFAEQTGVTPISFLSALRIQEAKTRVVTGGDKVIDIAYDVGYSSLGSFGKRFTAMVGVPPRALRAAARRFDPDRLLRALAAAADGPAVDARVPAVRGRIDVPPSLPDARGYAFVGLFDGGMPCGTPTHCAVVPFPGPFAIAGVPPGSYGLMAAALPVDADPADALLGDGLLVGGSGAFDVHAGRSASATVTLEDGSRPRPPVLVALPLLLSVKPAGRGPQ